MPPPHSKKAGFYVHVCQKKIYGVSFMTATKDCLHYWFIYQFFSPTSFFSFLTSHTLYFFFYFCPWISIYVQLFLISHGSISNSPVSLSFPHLTFYLYFSFFHPSSPLCIFSLISLCGLFSLNSSYPVISPANACPVSAFFSVKQEVLPDRKRVTTRSYLPITPVDTDSGSNFTCVASNPAVPMGKRTTLTLNVHRMLLFLSARL